MHHLDYIRLDNQASRETRPNHQLVHIEALPKLWRKPVAEVRLDVGLNCGEALGVQSSEYLERLVNT